MTMKESALAALDRAIEEAARPDGNPLVLRALLTDAREKVGLVQELARPRRVNSTQPTKEKV